MFTIKQTSTESCFQCDKTDTVEVKGKKFSGVLCWGHLREAVKRHPPVEKKASTGKKETDKVSSDG